MSKELKLKLNLINTCLKNEKFFVKIMQQKLYTSKLKWTPQSATKNNLKAKKGFQETTKNKFYNFTVKNFMHFINLNLCIHVTVFVILNLYLHACLGQINLMRKGYVRYSHPLHDNTIPLNQCTIMHATICNAFIACFGCHPQN